jgi:hypothetical protein
MLCCGPGLRQPRSLPAGAPVFAGSAHRRGVDWTTMPSIVYAASGGVFQRDRAGVSRLLGVSLSDWGGIDIKAEIVSARRGCIKRRRQGKHIPLSPVCWNRKLRRPAGNPFRLGLFHSKVVIFPSSPPLFAGVSRLTSCPRIGTVILATLLPPSRNESRKDRSSGPVPRLIWLQ